MKIFVALSTFAQESAAPLEALEKSKHPFVVNPTGKRLSGGQVVRMAADAEGVIAGVEPYDAEVLRQLPRLRCISRCGVGLDNIDLAAARDRGVAVVNTPDTVIRPVAELTVAMAFDLLKRLTVHTEFLRRGEWKKVTGGMLKGRTVGVVGLGRIGRCVADIFSRLDARVIGHDVHPDTAWAGKAGVLLMGLPELLAAADIVTLHAAMGKDAPCLIGAGELALMRPEAFLINTSRGKAVDEAALAEALARGSIAGAALDVFSVEPYSGALSAIPNVVLTPHVATLTRESRAEMELESVRNLLDFFSKA